MTSRYSLHKINHEKEVGFSAINYSKFKFGDKDVAREFGHSLAEGLIEESFFKNLVDLKKQIVVCSSPYSFVPTATFAMKDYFVQVLNHHLVNSGNLPVEEQKIHRTVTYKDDYGGLTAEERMSLIGKDSFHMDTKFIEDKIILFLDDIRITGSHEQVIKRMIESYDLKNEMVFLYFAELANKEIHPKIENDLNFAFVKSLLDLDKIIKNESFLINTRVIKFVLNSDPMEFKTFIDYQSEKFLQTMYHQAIGNGYSTIPEYSNNLIYIKETLKDNL